MITLSFDDFRHTHGCLFSRSANNITVLFVIESLGTGGAELQLAMLVRGLMKEEELIHVFVLQSGGELQKKMLRAGIVLHDGGYSRKAALIVKPFLLLRAFFRLWRLAGVAGPRVLHAFLPLGNFVGALAGRMAGVPMVITSRRGLGTHQDRHPGWRWFDRVANALSTVVTVNSLAVMNDTIVRDAIRRDKLVCIRNGLDFARFQVAAGTRERMRAELGLSPSLFAWVKVANLISYKGHADLIKALSGMGKNLAVRLILVGEDRGTQKDLEALAGRLGIAGRIMFLGRRDDIPEVLAAMDGYVMSSHEEGFSNAVLEAMAAGLPIIATDVGGNREALQDGRAGILVPPHSPEAMSAALLRVMADSALRKSLSQTAIKAAREQFSVDSMVKAYRELYLRAEKR